MPGLYGGGEHGRHDVYGPTPTHEAVLRAKVETEIANSVPQDPHDRNADQENEASLDNAQRDIRKDKLAVDAIIAYAANGGQPEIPTETKQWIRERNLLPRVYDQGLEIGGPNQALISALFKDILDPEGKLAERAKSKDISSPAENKFHRA